MPNEPDKPKSLHTHHYSHCPHCGEWLAGKSTCPACGKNVIDAPAGQTEQPEPKPYPIGDFPGFCPFHPASRLGPPGAEQIVRNTCDPENCALGMNQTKDCSIKSAARSLDEMLLGAAVRTAKDAQLHQLIKELSERLAAVLQSLAGSQKALPDMLRYFYDSQFAERALGLETVLSYINAAVQRIAPKAKTGEPT